MKSKETISKMASKKLAAPQSLNEKAYHDMLIKEINNIVRGLNLLKKQGRDCDFLGLIAGCLLSELNMAEIEVLKIKINKALKKTGI